MENNNDKNEENRVKKHPEPSENVQMTIETVIPDAENITKEKAAMTKQNGDKHQEEEENTRAVPLEVAQNSSTEQDNNIETVTP